MTPEAMTRMQIRVVLTIFRAEMARLPRIRPPEARADAARRLRLRSLNLLAEAKARLNGQTAAHPELLTELEAARSEINAAHDPPVAARVERSKELVHTS